MEEIDGERFEPKEVTEQQRRAVGTIRHEPTNNRMEAFPWMTEFRAMSRLPARPGSLVKLIKFFNKHVSANVGDCYKKSSRAARLKDHVREALLLFMYLYRFEQPQDQNRAVYLEQMSDLLAVYVDLELVASKRETEPQPCRIAARLVSSLCLCLENSTEHLLDTLIKVQLVNETFSDILDPVISKVIKLSSPPPRSKLDGLAYARYLLVYRLWKRLHINLAARKNIVAAALETLRSEPPSDLPTEILVERGVLPSSQNTQSDRPTTKHYLCQSYDLRNACVEFVKYSRSQNVVDEVVVQPTVVVASTSSSSSSSECSERDPRHLGVIKRKPRRRDVVLIDLTNEPITRVIRARPRIGWLESAKRSLRRIDVAARLRNKLKAKALIRAWRTLLDIDKACHGIKTDEKRESDSPTPKKLISLEEYKKRTANRPKNEVSLRVKVSSQREETTVEKDAMDVSTSETKVDEGPQFFHMLQLMPR